MLIYDLPQGATTSIIHRNLIQFGNVSWILLHENRQGGETFRAEVTFEPPPSQAIWERGKRYDFKGADRRIQSVRFVLKHHQRKVATVPSPVRDVDFPAEINLYGHSLGFGILADEKEMVVLKTVTSNSEAAAQASATQVGPMALKTSTQQSPIHLTLKLKKREIMVNFPVLLQSASATGSRTRSYRFPVSFDENFKIWKLDNNHGSQQSYVIHVRNPPWYSRRLENAFGVSHDDEAKQWTEEDLWTRQTDIVRHKDDFQLINQEPVSLNKIYNRINLARWTTFKFDLEVNSENYPYLQIFDDALKDFNIHVNTNTEDFLVYESADDAPYWTDIENEGDSKNPLDDGYALSFDLRYQLEVCLSNGRLSEYSIGKAFLQKLKAVAEAKAKQMLVHVDSYGEEILDPMSIFEDIRFQKPVRGRQLPKNCIMIHGVTVTATSVKVHTPSVEVSNRVIRKHAQFADRFLRVRFEDDEYRGQTKIYAGSNNKMQLVIERVKRALSSGIHVAGRHYEFLAYGNSQLRERGVYFFASTKSLTASMIRAEMGAFDNEKIVAKRAARMGQCFSTTHPIHYRLPIITKNSLIPDIVINGHNFTDGVGKISPLAATLVQGSLGMSGSVPSCFQFRLGGCKGVLVVDPTLSGIAVKIRPSQFKFESKSQELEIIRCSQFWQPFLNRQVIIVLSQLGVRDKVFLDMQKDTIQALSKAMKDDEAALQALRTHVDPNMMTLSMCDLITNGFRRVKEPFVMALMELWRAYSLKYLKEKAKIPVKDGAFVLGVVDETNSLRGHFDEEKPFPTGSSADKEKNLPQIFLQINDQVTGTRRIITGTCILARNPSLHPGDIRVVKAVDIPALNHLCDVVVMPQNGTRDLPSMCSGGDLDGDDYMVIWDHALIADIWNEEPHHYEPPAPKMAEGEITTQDIINFFVDYLENDSLGRIAHAHLANADYFDEGINHDSCLQLVQLHSTSVDYPKTGVPAKLPRRLEPTMWPHFMEKKKGKQYHAGKILGQLFDDVTKSVKRFGFRARYNLKFDTRIMKLDRPEEKYFAEVEGLKHEYDMAMQRIMAQHKIKTEFEVWTTFVMDHSKQSADYKFHEEIGRISKTLKDEYRGELVRLAGGSDFDRLMPYAVAAYQLTADQITTALAEEEERSDEADDYRDEHGSDDGSKPRGPRFPFCSFPWVLSDVLGKIASTSGLEATDGSDGASQTVKQKMKKDVKERPDQEVNQPVQEPVQAQKVIPERRPSKQYAHNASPEFKRASGQFKPKSMTPHLFDNLDPFKSSAKLVTSPGTDSTSCSKAEKAKAVGAPDVALWSQPILKASPPTPGDHSAQEGAGQNVDAKASVSASGPTDSSAASEKSMESNLRAEAPEFKSQANIYDTNAFSRKPSTARPNSSGSESLIHVSQEVSSVDTSPVQAETPETPEDRFLQAMRSVRNKSVAAGAAMSLVGESAGHLAMRPSGVIGDPALMSEEEKAAFLADDDL